jgi:hypothetical protein
VGAEGKREWCLKALWVVSNGGHLGGGEEADRDRIIQYLWEGIDYLMDRSEKGNPLRGLAWLIRHETSSSYFMIILLAVF